MNSRRQRDRLSRLRALLSDYGVSDTESLVAAVTRLIEEHRAALAQAAQAVADRDRMAQELRLACQTRDEAQAASTRDVLERRGVQQDLDMWKEQAHLQNDMVHRLEAELRILRAR